MAEVSEYLDRVAHVEAFGRCIKVDDVATAVAKSAKKIGSWTTRQLSQREFLVSCPDQETLQALMASGHIRGDGFSLLVNRWNKFKGGIPHQLKYKVYATLKDLPLFCWTVDAVATIISGFGTPCRASRTSLRWDDLSGFDMVFYCEEYENIPEKIEVTVGPFTYSVSIIINFVAEKSPHFGDSSSASDEKISRCLEKFILDIIGPTSIEVGSVKHLQGVAGEEDDQKGALTHLLVR